MIERAEPGDSLSVGVALDYVMDALSCERKDAKFELYRHVAKLLTLSAKVGDRMNPTAATHLSIYLYDGRVQDAKLYTRGYGTQTKWARDAKRMVKLCSWVESVE
jgi:hypothetical protein